MEDCNYEDDYEDDEVDAFVSALWGFDDAVHYLTEDVTSSEKLEAVIKAREKLSDAAKAINTAALLERHSPEALKAIIEDILLPYHKRHRRAA